MKVEHLSFSAHADAKGIMQLIKQSGAKNVVLVHGEKKKMAFLADRIRTELGLDCQYPPNGHAIEIATSNPVPIRLSRSFLERAVADGNFAKDNVRIKGIVVKDREQALKLLTHEEARDTLGIQAHRVRQATRVGVKDVTMAQVRAALTVLARDQDADVEIREMEDELRYRSLHACRDASQQLELSWEARDQSLARALVARLAEV
jgi:integrator complex subunit 11